MGRIVLAVPVHVIPQAIVPVLPAEGDLISQIMLIAALAVDDIAEQARFHHIQHHQLVPSVAAILQHHAGHTCLLRRPDQIPALLHRIGAAHLTGHRLSGAHSVDTHRHMGLPGSGDHHSVDRIQLQKLLVISKAKGRITVDLLDCCHTGFRPVSVQIAHCLNVDALPAAHNVPQQTVSPATQAHNANMKFPFIHVNILRIQ